MNQNLKLIKQKIGRTRYLEIFTEFHHSDWLKLINEIKLKISLESHLQLVGHKIHFGFNSLEFKVRPLIPVIGLPAIIDQNNLRIVDRESQEILIFHDNSENLFSISFEELLDKAKNLHSKLARKPEARISPDFDLVFDNEKIELHFFIQKDYIQD